MKADHFQLELLVRWFRHHVTQEQRCKLMQELPAAYNAMCGRAIVEVKLVADGEGRS